MDCPSNKSHQLIFKFCVNYRADIQWLGGVYDIYDYLKKGVNLKAYWSSNFQGCDIQEVKGFSEEFQDYVTLTSIKAYQTSLSVSEISHSNIMPTTPNFGRNYLT